MSIRSKCKKCGGVVVLIENKKGHRIPHDPAVGNGIPMPHWPACLQSVRSAVRPC